MRNNTFFIVTIFLIIYANIAVSNANIDSEHIYKFNDVRKVLSEIPETSTDESKDNNGTCQSGKDCLYRGTCTGNIGEKYCRCFRGSSGKNCETTDECVKNPLMCGDGTDVECAYNYDSKKAFCKCSDKNKRFDVPQKKCVDQKPCIEQKQCFNGGVCTARGSPKYCKCIVGTSGDFCERIEECIDKPTLCGNGTDVKCEFNVRQERAYCQCENQNLRFDWPQKKCVERKLCRGNNECLPFGACTDKCQDYEPCYSYSHIEEKDSCHCIEGTSGENCEIVDDCYNKVVDCGSGDDVVCTYSYITGFKGYTFCKCKNDTQSFDSVAKLCKDCDCGAMGDSCFFDDKGQKTCTCKPLSYNFGDKCEDCECGDGSKGCSFKGGNKKCFCNPGFFEGNNTCENCKCGEGSNGCSFEGGSKKCFCNSGFLEVNGRCERCDCGKNSTDCKFTNGKKTCTCEPGFAEGNYGICTPMCNDTHKCANGGLCLQNVCTCLAGTSGPFCEAVSDCKSKMCGNHQNVSCVYDTDKQRAFCKCRNTDSVFDTFDKTCKMCECDSLYRKNSEKCEFVLGKKVCHCEEDNAFRPDLDRCYDCYCGPHSTSCSYNEKGKKVCGCEDGFVDRSGRCRECDCGINGVCRYTQDAYEFTKVCICGAGYEDNKGTCVKCGCGPNGKCIFFNDGKTTACSCDTGYAEDSGKCKFCDCGPDSTCSFKSKRKYCKCPKGFEFVREYCRDIDECLRTKSCPEPGTWCVNTIGSFKCECKPGFIRQQSNSQETLPLCRKQEGEEGEKAPNYTPWKIGFGILTAVFMTMIIGLLIFIFKIRRNNNSRNPQAREPTVVYSMR